MSTPRFLTLPSSVRRTDIDTEFGTVAALESLPGSGVAERCPALLVPGFTGSKEDFIAVLQTLAGAGRQVIAIDLPGQYESPGPDDPAGYGCEALGAVVGALVETFDERVHLVGHSFGGLVTRETVITDPSRLSSFTLMSSGPGAIGGARKVNGQILLDTLPDAGIEHLWQTRLEPAAVAKGTSPEILAFLRRRMLMNSEVGLLGMADGLLNSPDLVDDLAKAAESVALPLLVIYGENDDAWDPAVQASMALRLDARKVVIPGASHSPAVEAPETTAGALTAFWNAAESIRRP